jgi:hypothetical protein
MPVNTATSAPLSRCVEIARETPPPLICSGAGLSWR